MANLQKHRAHESLNVDTSAVWDVQARAQVDDASTGVAEAITDVSSYNQICIELDIECYIRFDSTATATIVANNDPTVPASTLTFIKIPKGIGETVYLHLKGVTATSADKWRKLVLL